MWIEFVVKNVLVSFDKQFQEHFGAIMAFKANVIARIPALERHFY